MTNIDTTGIPPNPGDEDRIPAGDPRQHGLIEHDVATHPTYYWGAIVLLAVGVVLAGLGLLSYRVTLIGDTTNMGGLVWVLGLLYFIASFRIVDANHIGGIFVLGKPAINNVSGTFYFVPLGICRLITLPILTQEMEIPAEPQNIWREEGPPPAERENLRPPFRITFAEGENQDDPLQRRVTEEASFFVRLRIENFFNFYVRLGSIDEAKHQLEDIGVSLLAEQLPKSTLSEAIQEIETYSGRLAQHIRDSVARSAWGVKIVTARVKQFTIARSLNEKIQAMAESTATKRATIITAEGEKIRLTREGEGRAAAAKVEEQKRLTGRGEGLDNMAAILDIDQRDVLAAETAREIGTSDSTKYILGLDGFRQLLGAGFAVADGMTTARRTTQSAPQQPPDQAPPATGE